MNKAGFQVFIGLGNPGVQYRDTRHNIGERVLKFFASEMGWQFKYEKEFVAEVAVGNFQGNKIYLLFPHTYMNESGQSVRRFLDYYKIPKEGLVCIQDDVSLPFGAIRIRKAGGSGGHNGLGSIEAHLGTQDYVRLKVGVGAQEKGRDLADHVLGRFTAEESQETPALLKKGSEVLKRLLSEDIQKVMNDVNKIIKQSNKDLPCEGQENCQ